MDVQKDQSCGSTTTRLHLSVLYFASPSKSIQVLNASLVCRHLLASAPKYNIYSTHHAITFFGLLFVAVKL